ncbi:thioredoxin/glutaredoxin [Aeropyrum camini]|uniref:Predicted thioredoxin/glutaredoxin n=1 Tax=Aeropyrum camini SY1 = JCM 12091 TaxID=1198449 RepID=U3TGR9_9CREN|nr:thioredoxin/glutaredoxin [Aeropyrum camini]BAN90534.1 predicted thioredoxin/glutaredoxin [Aeropyrum camini SY1 = JCM 12091]
MQGIRVKIYVHKTCASSYSLFRGLKEKGLLDSVKIVEAQGPTDSGGRLIWSVPWVLLDSEVLAGDPVDLGVVESALKGSRIGVGDVVEAFMEAVLHSSLASSMAVLSRSLDPVLDENLASAAVRSPLSGVSPGEVLKAVGARADSLYAEWSGKLARALAMGFVRELWWARGGSLDPGELELIVSSGGFRLWLLAKGSLGRVGLPADPRLVAGYPEVGEAEDFLLKTGPALIRRVEREQAAILGDEEWMGL